MTVSIEAAIRAIIAEEVAAVERRIRENLSAGTDRTLDVPEAAAHLGVSEKLIYRMCQERRIPHERYGMPGSRRPTIKLRLNDLEKWRADQRALNYRG
ncbi:helix-turn-helix domain-containing protein [Paenibacillus oryzisoli]|uniref:helix-turn-helix domain-containing protein n=1 Tax=Paenibacillus oryzisoli TaxID=1850517 RepID=UPI003D272B16